VTSSIGSPEEGSVGTREAIASTPVVVRSDQEGLSPERNGMNTQVELDPEIARIVDRLKSTQALENAEAEAEGRRIGSNWAKETASAKELKELAVGPWEEAYFRWQPREDNSIWDEIDRGGDPGVFEGDDGRVENWLTVAFTRGVLLGASDVYEQVGHLV
jgi:hypothetical protein